MSNTDEEDTDNTVDVGYNNSTEEVLNKKIKTIEDKISKQTASVTYLEQWKNRRWMAWLSLISTVLLVSYVLVYLPLDRLLAINPLLSTFIWGMVSIVGFYMGASVWASITRK